MREFFRGWRRKVGCTLLVVAVAAQLVSFRSYFWFDQIGWGGNGVAYRLDSESGRLGLMMSVLPLEEADYGFWWDTWKSGPHVPDWWERPRDYEWKSEYRFVDFCAGSADPRIKEGSEHVDFIVLPDWSCVLAPAIISAYLLLWKQRKAS